MIYVDDQIQAYTHEQIGRWLTELPQWRRERVLAIKHDAGRRQSLLAFRLLQRGLAEEYGITEIPPFRFNEHGKPSLPPAPPQGRGASLPADSQSPIPWGEDGEGPYFSLSHCREAVACIIDERPCGIDIESRGRRVSDSLIRYAMNDEEIQQIAEAESMSLPQGGGREAAFLRLWTRKEAVLKLIGTGIRDSMKDVLRHCPYDVETRETEHYVLSIATQRPS